MTPNLLLAVVAFSNLLWPYLFVLRKYKTVTDEYIGPSAKAFSRIDTFWLMVSVAGMMIGSQYLRGYALAILPASIVLPPAIFAGINGTYPERTRGGHVYYADYKNSITRLLSTHRPYELRIIGWIQCLVSMGVMLISLRMLLQT
jgi:hypothetical protein